MSLIKIRTLASAGVPLFEIGQMLQADTPAFAEAVQRIDSHLRDEIERLETRGSLARSHPRLEEAADIMAGLLEQACTSGETKPGDEAHDDLPFHLLDALAVESDPRAQRMLDLMRERGRASWTRLERLAEPPG